VPLAERREVTLKYARRHRGADAGGFHNAMNAGLDIVAPLSAARTKAGQRFNEITRKDGLGAALEWRTAQFAE